MVIDPSALIAYLKGEPEAARLESVLLDAASLRISAASWVEAGIVADSLRGEEGGRRLDALMDRLQVEIVPLTERHAGIARAAYQRYGKGHHRARLNLGDCFSYALARALAEPLLFVGDNFSHTDVDVVHY